MTESISPTAYLDHAATTPLRKEALEAMLPYLTEQFANPSGIYASARRARRAVDDAREQLAWVLGCAPGEIVFTASGSEADNLAVHGAASAGRAVASAVEHKAVLAPLGALGGAVAPVLADGRVDLERLAELLDPSVRLVSVMAVNSEVGVIQPLKEVVDLVRARAPEALVHCDAVQALPWLDLTEWLAGCDLLSISAHKFGGPKGVGALVVRSRAQALRPLMLGGGQERGRRPGTENVAGIVGAAVAAQLTAAERAATVARVGALRDHLVDSLVASWPGLAESAPRPLRVVGNAHLKLPEGVDGEELLWLCDEMGVCGSVGSACASGAREPSHVLLAMGWTKAEARQAVRFSLGASTTAAEIDRAIEVVSSAIARLAPSAP